MNKLRIACAVLLALPLLLFGGGYFIKPVKPQGSGAGVDLLLAMREGGLMTWICVSHVVVGVLLVIPRTRFFGALMQLPITLGIVAFHAAMLPEGLVMAVPMLLLNVGAMGEPDRLRALVGVNAGGGR